MDCFDRLTESLKEIDLIADHAQSLLEDRSNEGNRILGNAMTRSGLVLLCGYFEGYLRDLMEEFFEAINDGEIRISILPAGIFSHLLEITQQAYTQNKPQFFEELKLKLQEDQHHKISHARFSKTNSNPSVDVVETMFSNIGIEQVIDHLSIIDFELDSTFTTEPQSEMVKDKIEAKLNESSPSESALLSDLLKIIDEKWLPKSKRRKVGYVSAIEELLKKRNRIAHGEGRELITPSDLKMHNSQIAGLSIGLHRLVSQKLETLLTPSIQAHSSP